MASSAQRRHAVSTVLAMLAYRLRRQPPGRDRLLRLDEVTGALAVSFLTLLSAIGNAGTFFLFAGLSIVAVVYFQRKMPETRNRSLQDIERDLGLPGSSMAGTTAQPVAGRV